LLFLAASCRREIGDACKNSIECSYETDRLCDIAQPGGYCTVEGCDERTCPDDSVCIRFFPRQYLTMAKPCQAATDCAPEELCLQDGRCAPRASERRYCAASCVDNGDCRGGYECRLAGTQGTMSLHANKAATVHFCAPVDR
jgi:hypothetical protein